MVVGVDIKLLSVIGKAGMRDIYWFDIHLRRENKFLENSLLGWY